MKHPEFGKRFRLAVEHAGVEDTQEALATRLGVSGVMIWSYRNGDKLPRMNTAVRISKALGVNVNWLMTGDGPMTSAPESKKTISRPDAEPLGYRAHRMPLISTVSAGIWCESPDEFGPGDAEEWLPLPDDAGPRSFALRVDGDSMTSPYPGQRSYPHGCIVYVDPDRPVTNGCRVVAKTPDNEYTFKTYTQDAGRHYLKPINPQYPMIEVTDHVHICGVIFGTYMPE